MHHVIEFVHASYSSSCSMFFLCNFLLCALVPYTSTILRKTRANRIPSTPSVSPSRVQLFKNERSCEAYKKLNSKRKIWAERSVILDEVNPAIRANLESRG